MNHETSLSISRAHWWISQLAIVVAVTGLTLLSSDDVSQKQVQSQKGCTDVAAVMEKGIHLAPSKEHWCLKWITQSCSCIEGKWDLDHQICLTLQFLHFVHSGHPGDVVANWQWCGLFGAQFCNFDIKRNSCALLEADNFSLSSHRKPVKWKLVPTFQASRSSQNFCMRMSLCVKEVNFAVSHQWWKKTIWPDGVQLAMSYFPNNLLFRLLCSWLFFLQGFFSISNLPSRMSFA